MHINPLGRLGARLLAAGTALALVLPTSASAADPAAIQKKLDQTAAEYGRLESEAARTEARIAKLEADLGKAEVIVAEKSVLMRERAFYLYKNGGASSILEGIVSSGDLGQMVRRLQMLDLASERDDMLVEGLRVTQGRATDIRESLQRTRKSERAVSEGLKDKQRQLREQFKGAQGAAKVGRFGKFDAFTLPIAGPTGFSDTWGAPRSGGRRHKGTDVMAPCGAQVVAVTNGVVSNLHSGGNGGIMAYVRATNGDVFFYSHLRGYASGVRSGTPVAAGQLIGYNGNSGNARGGPCHVHFEWHPGGGTPVNPYRILASVR
ncbi:MAG: peptidoglycan DD-metalloendopeptidase family protein [Actinomycetota bacterium]